MSVTSVYTLSPTDLSAEVNKGKDLLLDKLRQDGVIDSDQWQHYAMYYGIIIGQPTFFSSLWEKFIGKKKSKKNRYMLVKLLNLPNEEELNANPDWFKDEEDDVSDTK